MDDLEEKLNAVLNNPQMMSQILSMAQSLGQNSRSESAPPKQEPAKSPLPQLPLSGGTPLRAVSELMGKGSIDREQQALLKALSPYLHQERIGKLERAMRAAKLAQVASTLLGSGGLQSLLGR